MNNEIQEIRYQVGEAWKGTYNAATTYGNANVVQDPTGLSVYRSLKPGNVGHPLTDTAWWFLIIDLSSIKEESDRIKALNDAIAADEAQRVENENGRVTAEQGRVDAENARVTAEQGRVTAEQQRVSAEQQRASQEQTRISQEQSRVTAEQGRVAAEAQRVQKEQLRENNEAQRVINETNRVAAEAERVAQYAADHQQAVADHDQYVDFLGVFDLSKHNAVGGVLATYADLSAALTALNALDSQYKYGGMSIKFVQSSDNKYVQYRSMSDTFSTTVTDWQGVDSEPTAGSDNLVKSGGVYPLSEKMDFVIDTSIKKGYYYNAYGANVIEREDSTRYITDFVSVAGLTSIVVYHQLDIWGSPFPQIAIFDANKNYLDRATLSQNSNIINLPANAAFVKSSMSLTNIESTKISGGGNDIFIGKEFAKTIFERVKEMEPLIKKLETIDDVPSPGSSNLVESGGVIRYINAHIVKGGTDVRADKVNALIKELYLPTKGQYGDVLAVANNNASARLLFVYRRNEEGPTSNLSLQYKFEKTNDGTIYSGIEIMVSESGDAYALVDWSHFTDAINSFISDNALITDNCYTLDTNGTINALLNGSSKSSERNNVILNIGKTGILQQGTWTENNEIYSNSGDSSLLVMSGQCAISHRIFIYDFIQNTAGASYFGAAITELVETPILQSAVKLNTTDKTLAILKFENRQLTDTPFASVNFSDNILNKRIRIIINYNMTNLIVRMYDLTTGDMIAEVEGTPTSTNSPEGGWWYDAPAVKSAVGIDLLNVTVSIPMIKQLPTIWIAGDSITEGVGATTLSTGWAQQLSSLIGNCYVSGRSGGHVEGVHERVTKEVSKILPQYAIVQIGTNGGVTVNQMNGIYHLLKSLGVQAIFNTIPLYGTQTGVSVTNTRILAAAEENDIPVIRMDIALALNHDLSQGIDPSLYTVDKTHPNQSGYNIMLERVKIDCTYLFNFNDLL